MLNIGSFLSETRPPVTEATVVAAVLAVPIITLLHGIPALKSVSTLTLGLSMVAWASAFVGWRLTLTREQSNSNRAIVLWSISILSAIVVLAYSSKLSPLSAAGVALLPLLLFVRKRLVAMSHTARQILIPLTFGSAFIYASASLGVIQVGAFPAVIGALFVAVLRSTLDIEEDIFENHASANEIEVEHHYRHKLAFTALILFLFGTVSLWPWLGELYGKAYFWILILGVLIPLAFFWGRIRQPKMEGARVALIRFNRIAPVLGLIHVLGFLTAH